MWYNKNMKFKVEIEVSISPENEGIIPIIANSFPLPDETEYDENVSDMEKAKNHICNIMTGTYKQETYMPIERGSRDYFGVAGIEHHNALMQALINGGMQVNCYFEE